MKKYIFLILLLSCGKVFGAEPIEVNGIWYYFNDNTLTASVTNSRGGNSVDINCYTGNIVIPTTITYNNKTYSITSILKRAFDSSSTLTSVVIPNSVTSIGDAAFSECIGLTSFSLPNSVTQIGKLVFSKSGLMSPVYNARIFAYLPPSFEGHYSIPDGIETIANGAFDGCDSLTSITIPSSVSNIKNYYLECQNVHTVYYTGTIREWCLKNWDGSVLPSDYELYIQGEKVIDLAIPNTTTTINKGAFCGCGSLTSVIIPNSVTRIEEKAFYDCKNLIEVTIPNSVTNIGYNAFNLGYSNKKLYYTGNILEWCAKSWMPSFSYDLYIENSIITNLSIIPDNITSINNGAFLGCRSLTSIVIPLQIRDIGNYAFQACSNVTSIIIHDLVTHIGHYAFDGTLITSPEPVYNSKIFAYLPFNYKPDSIYTIPNGITTIVGGAFNQCRISSVVIPSSVKSIGGDALGPGAIKTIVCMAVTPPQLPEESPYGLSSTVMNLSGMCMYVPDKSVNVYKATKFWNDLQNILPISSLPQAIENLSIENYNTPRKILRDGKVIIFKGDKEYTIFGTEL